MHILELTALVEVELSASATVTLTMSVKSAGVDGPYVVRSHDASWSGPHPTVDAAIKAEAARIVALACAERQAAVWGVEDVT